MQGIIVQRFIILSPFFWIFPFIAVAQQHDRSPVDTLLVRWETHLQPMTSSSMDVPLDQVMDALGNLYVTGKSEGQETSYDYLTVKYNSSGIIQWTARYDGPYHGIDIPNAIAVDNAGNVFVTGMSIGSDSTYSDFATVKYNSQGIQQWVRRFNGPGNVSDAANAIAVDLDGNTYVTGFQTDPWDYDFITIKYDPQGVEEWTATYDPPTHRNDVATAIVLDVTGNIFVAGWSTDSVGLGIGGYWKEYSDYTVIKYDPSGSTLWVATYNVSDTLAATLEAIGIDDEGSVYVTGRLISLPDYQWAPPGYTSGVATVKLSPDGSLVWANLFPNTPWENPGANDIYFAEGMAFDADGNVYVAGTVGSIDPYIHVGDSLLTIKYSPDGDRQWVAYHDDQTNAVVSSGGIAVGPNGNIYVTGSLGNTWYPFVGDSIATICYNVDGMVQWTRYYVGTAGSLNLSNGITADESGNVYVIGSSGPEDEADFISLKYSPTGSETWVTPTTGPGNSIAFVADAKVDEQGNINITGTAVGIGLNKDYATMKLEPSGGVLWSATYDSPNNLDDYASAIATDPLGNVYVTGNSSTYSAWGSATIKYSPSGNQLWVARFDSSHMSSIAVDPDGNVYVGGFGIVKYDANGIQEWHTSSGFWINALATSDSGYLYATGEFWPSGGGFLKKFNNQGVELWTTMAPSAALALDNLGNVYVSVPGYSSGDGITKKFTPSGVELWSANFGGDKIVVRGPNTLYVGSGFYFPIHKLTTDGMLLWTRGVDSYLKSDFDVDAEGNVYVIGTTLDGRGLHADKYTSDGDIEWTVEYGEGFRGSTVKVDFSSNVYLIFEKEGHDFSTTPIVAKNSHLPVVSSTDDEELSPQKFRLHQNYPNPFNPQTTIAFEVPSPGFVELKLFDILGREIRTLVHSHLTAGTHTVILDAKDLATGVYLYRLKSGDFVRTAKLMLLR